MITASIVADSRAPNGKRLTTMVLRYPRFVHSEFMTHRVFSRNAASSRAIPVKKMLEMVKNDPAMPVFWGKNQSGMQAAVELGDPEISKAKDIWLLARDRAVEHVERLVELGLHKQIANRILEPWCWITVICSATEWDNFYNLREHEAAQPEIRRLAQVMLDAQNSSTPTPFERLDQWHLPFIKPDEEKLPLEVRIKCSVARCARVSYLTHDGAAPDIKKDIDLHDRLVVEQPAHASPAEHQAFPHAYGYARSANFAGWVQYRKTLRDETCKHFGRLNH